MCELYPAIKVPQDVATNKWGKKHLLTKINIPLHYLLKDGTIAKDGYISIPKLGITLKYEFKHKDFEDGFLNLIEECKKNPSYPCKSEEELLKKEIIIKDKKYKTHHGPKGFPFNTVKGLTK